MHEKPPLIYGAKAAEYLSAMAPECPILLAILCPIPPYAIQTLR